MTQPGINTVNSSPSGASSKYVHLCGNSISTYDDNSISDIKPLKVDRQALGILLDSGVILSPRSPYQDFFVLNAGDSLSFDASTNIVTTSGHFHYPRALSARRRYSEKDFEILLLEAVKKSIDKSSQILLFLSGGIDSSTLACALAKSESRDRTLCITYRSKFQDESEIAALITKKTGLAHEIVDIDNYKVRATDIESFFKHQLVPSMDLCATVYMHCGLNSHRGNILLDGSGNDLFIGYIQSLAERRIFALQRLTPYWLQRSMGSFRKLHRNFMFASKTSLEVTGGLWTFLSGSQLVDDLTAYNNLRRYWQTIDRANANLDYIDARCSFRGRYMGQEKFIRKIKNAAQAYQMKLALPWTYPELADYCYNLRDEDLFDSKTMKEKVFARHYLTNNLGIDFFAEKKNYFAYNFSEFVAANIDLIKDIILSNDLIEAKLTERHLTKALKMGNYGFVYQLFLLLAWHKFSAYIER